MSPRRIEDEPAPALVLVDKPAGLTSHDVVRRVRRLAGTRRVGHAGTLDPMATGVLVLGLGRATRLLTYLVGADKEYLATIRLGVATGTDDAEGETVSAAGAEGVTPEAVAAGVAALSGPILQVPSAVSAIKVDGERAYKRVRAGEDVVLDARPVTVRSFDVLRHRSAEIEGPDGSVPVLDLDVLVTCSSGTYVRALARDLGAGLKGARGPAGGHLTALRRTRVGPYGLDGPLGARPLAQLEEEFAAVPVAEAARQAFGARELTEQETADLRHGRRLPGTGTDAEPIGAYAPDGTLVALLAERGGLARPLLVLDPA